MPSSGAKGWDPVVEEDSDLRSLGMATGAAAAPCLRSRVKRLGLKAGNPSSGSTAGAAEDWDMVEGFKESRCESKSPIFPLKVENRDPAEGEFSNADRIGG